METNTSRLPTQIKRSTDETLYQFQVLHQMDIATFLHSIFIYINFVLKLYFYKGID